MKRLLLISTIFIAQMGLAQSPPEKLYKLDALPGTAKIDSNLYMDYTEVTNFSYLEYLYWIERVFGSRSDEYKLAMPDTIEWIYAGKCLRNLLEYYLRHPDYREYPVVNVSQEQARKFCKWRSDRVFELLMIKMGVCEHNPAQTRENHFSIENYFKSNYYLSGSTTPVKPNENYLYFPVYRLPNETEWKQGKQHFDKTNAVKTCKSKWCDFHINKGNSFPIQYNISPCDGDSIKVFPMHTVRCDKNRNVGWHFYGNASEWLDQPHTHIGGSWKDSTTHMFNQPVIYVLDKSREHIGFRCVAEWKKMDLTENTSKKQIDKTIQEAFDIKYDYEIIGYTRSNDMMRIKDTTIHIDFTSNSIGLDSLINSNELLEHYNLLTPPPHGGDPNSATISVVVDWNGNALHTYVVKDVKNKCDKEPWKMSLKKKVKFSTYVKNGKPYCVEYVFKVSDIMYCVPEVVKETSPRKTFSFNDTAFEVGATHRIVIEYGSHPRFYNSDENQAIYDSIVLFLNNNKNIKIEVSCHTDQRGTDDFNLKLSQRRADAIMENILYQDVDSNQISALGYGETKPIIDLDIIRKMESREQQEEAYAINRRTELVIIEVRE